jgi:hypothetical protein
VRAHLRDDLDETGLGGPFQQGMFRGFDAKIPPFKHAMQTAGNAASEMVAFHDFLVSIGGRVHYDGGTVRFESMNDLSRAQEMEQHARAQFQEAAQYAARSEREGRDQLQQMNDLIH